MGKGRTRSLKPGRGGDRAQSDWWVGRQSPSGVIRIREARRGARIREPATFPRPRQEAGKRAARAAGKGRVAPESHSAGSRVG